MNLPKVVTVAVFLACLLLSSGSWSAEPAPDTQCTIDTTSVLTNRPESIEFWRRLFARAGWNPDSVSLGTLNSAGAKQLRVAGKSSREISDALATMKFLGSFAADERSYYVEPNYRIGITEVIPDDEFFHEQWGLRSSAESGTVADISATSAWDITRGAPPVTIAVLDTGIDSAHEDLCDRLWDAPQAFSVTIDGQKKDCAQGTQGFDAVANECVGPTDPHKRCSGMTDENGHGTHIAGIAGAKSNNTKGVAGVTWHSVLLPIVILDKDGKGDIANAIRAMEFLLQVNSNPALNTRVRILSNSWGYAATGKDCVSTPLRDQIQRMGDQGMLFVAAAGNSKDIDIDATNARFYPASFNLPNMLTVTAADNKGIITTTFGRISVHVAAPGVDIYTTMPTDIQGKSDYGHLSGSSMAVPFVSGVASLLWSHCPGVTTAALKRAILDSVEPVPAWEQMIASGGRLSAYKALQLVEHNAVYPECALKMTRGE